MLVYNNLISEVLSEVSLGKGISTFDIQSVFQIIVNDISL